MYLLDTVIFFFKGKFDIHKSIQTVGVENCFNSEITLAELLFGAEKSTQQDKHRAEVADFIEEIGVLPIFPALNLCAKERARLEAFGTPMDDFDLLIGTVTMVNDFTLFTHNIKHFSRLNLIKLVDWTINPAKPLVSKN